MTKKVIQVVAAAIIKDKQLLAMQRSEKMTLSGLWELPGGKIEKGESPQLALKREIQEELAAEIVVEEFVNTASYDYDFGQVELTTYLSQFLSDTFIMKEHSQFRWLRAEELFEVEWAPVDIPAIHLIEAHLKQLNR